MARPWSGLFFDVRGARTGSGQAVNLQKQVITLTTFNPFPQYNAVAATDEEIASPIYPGLPFSASDLGNLVIEVFGLNPHPLDDIGYTLEDLATKKKIRFEFAFRTHTLRHEHKYWVAWNDGLTTVHAACLDGRRLVYDIYFSGDVEDDEKAFGHSAPSTGSSASPKPASKKRRQRDARNTASKR